MKFRAPVMVSMVLLAGLCNAAAAQDVDFREAFRNGRWRLETQGFAALYSGKTDREGDKFATFSVEYEMPVSSHFSVGLRGYPLFVYLPHRTSDDTLYGVAGGVAARYYFKEEAHRGWFAEGGGSALWHSRCFRENGSRINFMLEAGLGYQFERDWHDTFKFTHISNASMHHDNAGVNALGLGVGYTF